MKAQVKVRNEMFKQFFGRILKSFPIPVKKNMNLLPHQEMKMDMVFGELKVTFQKVLH